GQPDSRDEIECRCFDTVRPQPGSAAAGNETASPGRGNARRQPVARLLKASGDEYRQVRPRMCAGNGDLSFQHRVYPGGVVRCLVAALWDRQMQLGAGHEALASNRNAIAEKSAPGDRGPSVKGFRRGPDGPLRMLDKGLTPRGQTGLP